MTAVFSTVFLEEQKKIKNFSSEGTEGTKGSKGTDFLNFFDFFSWNRLTALKFMLNLLHVDKIASSQSKLTKDDLVREGMYV